MDIDGFWALVECSRRAHPRDEDAQTACLCDLVSELKPDEVLTFAAIFYAMTTRATRWEIWGAGYTLDGGMSNDSFRDFISWLISRGRDAYENALADPDSLADVPGIELDDYHSAEWFGATPCIVLKRAFGESLSTEERGKLRDLKCSYLSPEEREFNELSPGGERWDEADVGATYPRLARVFDQRTPSPPPLASRADSPTFFCMSDDDSDGFTVYVNWNPGAVVWRDGDTWSLRDVGGLSFDPVVLPSELDEAAVYAHVLELLSRWIDEHRPDLHGTP